VAEQVLGERIPAARGVAAAELAAGRGVEPAPGQELPCRLRLRAGQLLGVEGCRERVRLDEPGPLPGRPVRTRTAVGVAELDAGPAGQALHRLAEGQVLDPLDEPDHVPAGRAAEAVEQPAGWRHRQRRGLFVMERADPLEIAAAGIAQLDVLADHLGDIGPFPDGGDVLVANPARHGPESRVWFAIPCAAARVRPGRRRDWVACGQRTADT
jgi:hypothetical protein